MLEDRVTPAAAFSEFLDPNPSPGNGFGTQVVPLATGNVVVTAPYDDAGGIDAGAVYLFNGATGALISSLIGSHTNDLIGVNGVTPLSNGNFVVGSPNWNNGPASNAGALTWGSGLSGVSGAVSAANSLVGSTINDGVGYGVTALPGGNFVVPCLSWDNGSAIDAGAVTWGNGSTGVTGPVSPANSLVGSTAGDSIGNNIQVLSNGNYVAISPFWTNGSAPNAGAVTFCNGATGRTGVVGPANSLVGSQMGDQVGSFSVMALSNGHYVVISPDWHYGTAAAAGAVTWGSGTVGVTGSVGAGNSLVGTTANDRVGGNGIKELVNGDYVVVSPEWHYGPVANAGAVTWCSGTAATSGAVSAANSLIGGSTDDQVGVGGVSPLSNGNYVVRSPEWNNGAVTDAGAVTWGSGTSGVSGLVSAANSLVGAAGSDRVGFFGVEALTNGNYIVLSPYWNNGSIIDAGAATWGNGTVGVIGLITAANSLVGGTTNDFVGSNGKPLSNGNYVVLSQNWDNGAIADAGAATWGNGTTGVAGLVSVSNSLVGVTANDRVGSNGIVALSNGNYVVCSPQVTVFGSAYAGAVTWGNGTVGITGPVGYANSLIGNSPNDFVGNVVEIGSGNYVVISQSWDLGSAADAGAVTWANGLSGVTGYIFPSNSLTGTAAGDHVGSGGVTRLANGNYVVVSPEWTNGSVAHAGAVTFGVGNVGVTGLVTAGNSLVGSSPNDQIGGGFMGGGVVPLSNGNYLVASIYWDNGAVLDTGAVTFGDGTLGITGPIHAANSALGDTSGYHSFTYSEDKVNGTLQVLNLIPDHVRLGSSINGFGPAAVIYSNPAWSGMAPGTVLADADPTVAGNQPATIAATAFPVLALEAVATGGTLTAIPGTYAGGILSRAFNFNTPTGTVTVNSPLSGPAGLIKTGNGSLYLSAANSFTGGTTLLRGTLVAATDSALGAAAGAVTAQAPGELVLSGTTATGRTYYLNGSTFRLNAGVTLTATQAEFNGGFFRGPGTLATTLGGATAFTGSTLRSSLSVLANGNDSFTNVASAAPITVAPGSIVKLDGFTNEAAGRLTVNGKANLTDFATLGQMTVTGTITNMGTSGLSFGGGSVTTVDAGGLVTIGTADAHLAGGLIKNAGSFGGTGTVVVDYGGRLQGGGTFGAFLTQNGGIFAPGSSPGTATTNQFNLNGGGRLEFEVTDASGTPGHISGWDLVNVQPTIFSTTGLINYTSTSSDKYIIQLKSRLDDGIGNSPGNIDNFNSALSYAWKFADGTNALTSSSGTFNAANFQIDTTGFSNSFTGGFAVELRDGGKNLYVVYTPVSGPFVTGFTVNGGAVQRSRITTVQVNFATPTDAATLQPGGAITFTRTLALPGGTVGTVVNTSNGLLVSPVSGMVSSVTLTFANVVNAGVENASLGDGYWRLAIPSASFQSTLNDPSLRRLFGDIDNTGNVDGAIDFPAFGATFNSNTELAFDFNEDGIVDGAVDFPAFGARFNVTL